jgi:hypothetical protein
MARYERGGGELAGESWIQLKAGGGPAAIALDPSHAAMQQQALTKSKNL